MMRGVRSFNKDANAHVCPVNESYQTRQVKIFISGLSAAMKVKKA
jgi:hypothetical protein